MRLQILSILVHLLTAVWAGGYQGALERVLMYQAYVIDTTFNTANNQIMGWQCVKREFDANRKVCTGSWTRTPGHQGNQPLTYNRFVYSLGKTSGLREWAVFDNNGDLDIEATARSTYDEMTTVRPGQRPEKAKVLNFGANTFMRDTVEWNDCIKKTSKMVARTYEANRASLTDEQKKLFADFDKATVFVLEARVGDHGPYVIQKAQTRLNADGITVEKKSVGTNPIPDRAAWETVDWRKTIEQAEDAGIADAKKKVGKVAGEVYAKGGGARVHKHVIDSYLRGQERQVNCGRL